MALARGEIEGSGEQASHSINFHADAVELPAKQCDQLLRIIDPLGFHATCVNLQPQSGQGCAEGRIAHFVMRNLVKTHVDYRHVRTPHGEMLIQFYSL